jgi:4-hydroxy-tetrahydrodipicolinate synthase
VPVYVHALDYSIPETVALANYAKEAGADAVMWWVPIEFARSDEQAVEWFRTVAPQVDMPVFAYNTYHSGRSFAPETFERIVELPNICTIKDAVNDYAHAVELLDRVGEQVVVSNPLEEYLPSMLINTRQQVLLGATSVYLMQSPARQPVRDYVDAIASGDEASAWEQYYALKPLRDVWTDVYRVLWVKEAASHPIPTLKAWMDLAGMRGGAVRPPLHDLTPEQVREFAARLEGTGWADKLYPDRKWDL